MNDNDYQIGLRLLIARINEKPWQEVTLKEVDSWAKEAKNLNVKPIETKKNNEDRVNE